MMITLPYRGVTLCSLYNLFSLYSPRRQIIAARVST